MHHWYDYLRLATALLAMLSLYILARHRFKRGDVFTKRLRELSWTLQAFLVLLIEGSLEQIVKETSWGPRTLLSFIIALVCLRAVTIKEGYLTSEARPT